jgi:NADH-quinone oxidoreductase subunit H
VQDRTGPNRTDLSFGQHVEDWKAVMPKFLHWVPEVLGAIFGHRAARWILGQPAADGLKLLFKEDWIPPFADKPLFVLAPAIAVATAMLGWAVIPWGGYFMVTAENGATSDVVRIAALPFDVGVLYILAVGSLAVYAVVLAGFASNNKYAFFGGVRSCAQMLSYEIPMGLAVLAVLLMHGTLRADLLVAAQAMDGWNILWQPILGVIFFVAILAETNRAPFDLAEAEQELVGGFHTEYSSMKWAMFFLGEYIHMITGSAFLVLLFFGGWHFPGLPVVTDSLGIVLLQMLVFFLKVALVLFLFMWVRWTLPRFRFDQLMRLAWQNMIPVGIFLVVLTGAMLFTFRAQTGSGELTWSALLMNLAVIVLGPFLWALMPKEVNQNRRVRLSGSRFSPLPSGARQETPAVNPAV